MYLNLGELPDALNRLYAAFQQGRVSGTAVNEFFNTIDFDGGGEGEDDEDDKEPVDVPDAA